MKSSRIGFVAVVLLLFAAGESFADVTFAPKADDDRAKNALPPSGKALVFLFSEGDAEQTGVGPVWLDNNRMGIIAPRSYYLWAVTPGKHSIIIGADRRVALTFNTEAGRNYFVELRIKPNGMPHELKSVSYARGRVAVNRCRLIGVESANTAMALGRMPPETKPTEEPMPVTTPVSRASHPGHMQGAALMLKTGSVTMTKRSQTIQTTSGPLSSEFASSTSSPFSIAGEWRMQDGLAFGIELIQYSNKLTDTASTLTSTMDFSGVLFNGKKYFSGGGNYYPYLGLGAGFAKSNFSGAAISGDTNGLAFQVLFGIEMRWQQFSFIAELKQLSAKPEDDAGNSVNAGIRGLYIGGSVRF